MTSRPRTLRVAALALAIVAVLAACGSEGSSNDTGSGSGSGSSSGTSPGGAPGGSAPAGDTIASTFVLGGPPECPERAFCQIGLEETYGLVFKDFKALDAGGPLTVAALENGDIQVGLMFTTDPTTGDKGWVMLEDDEGLQPADNVTPVFNEAIATEYGDDLKTLIDGVSEQITTEDLTALNKQVSVEKEDAAAAAAAWVEENVDLPADAPAKNGTTIVVGSANFDENAILAEIYAAVLEGNGYPVETSLKIGSREIYFPQVESGAIGLVPEYSGTLLQFLDDGVTPSSDTDETAEALATAFEGRGVVAFAAAPAQSKNAFVVTAETAEQYGLVKTSDLAKPAP